MDLVVSREDALFRTIAPVIVMLLGLLACSRKEKATPIVPADPSPTEVALPPPAPTPIVEADAAPPDFASMPKYAFDKPSCEAFCREQWTKRGELDEGMFAYCVRQETAGHANMLQMLKKFGKNPWMTRTFPSAWAKWTKRGSTQYTMVAHELKQEGESFLDYEYERKQPGASASKLDKCEAEWRYRPDQWQMTMYCYKN